jgi:amidase
MARTVADAALMLDAMAGLDARDPLSLEAPARPFADAAAAPALPLRVAYSPDLGVTPVAAEVRDACGRAVERLAAAGVEVEQVSPDLTGAPEAFLVLRGAEFVAGMESLYATDCDRLKPDIIWNIEFGLSLSVERIAQAEQARGAIFQRMSEFMAGYDLLLCPTACVAPFDVSRRWIREVSGVTFDNYVEWLRITSAITLTSCPVVALPCALTEEGLPVGMQLIGRPRGEWGLLSAAAAVEQVFDLAGRVPLAPRGG